MNQRILSALCLWAGVAVAPVYGDPAPAAPLPPERLRAVAERWMVPGDLPSSSRRELDTAIAAMERNDAESASAHWRAFLDRQIDGVRPFNPLGCVDYLLNRLAVRRDRGAEDACRRLRYYDAQETAVLEHLATLEKHISAYGADAVTDAPLREPELHALGNGAEPVTLPAARSVDGKELEASLARWRERLPEISAARAASIDAFVKAVNDNAALAEELARVDAGLRAAIAR